MPTYEFYCDDVNSPYHENPKVLFMSVTEYEATKDTLKCEVTKQPLKRLWKGGGPGLRFKGAGFDRPARV